MEYEKQKTSLLTNLSEGIWEPLDNRHYSPLPAASAFLAQDVGQVANLSHLGYVRGFTPLVRLLQTPASTGDSHVLGVPKGPEALGASSSGCTPQRPYTWKVHPRCTDPTHLYDMI